MQCDSLLQSKTIVYGSVCSGIEAATVAWHHLGWKPAFFSEIDAFPRAVLQHHYPDVPCHGDFTTIKENDYAAIDLLVGGTPCQAFSVAGLRKGFADERGNLTLEFIRLAERLKPQWLVWENVPGVLSQDGGRAFGSFLGGLAECGYGFAYRVLDAQHFGVPQRRRRVFVVGYLGDWRPPAAVLFERESLLRNLTPSREKRERPAPTISSRTKGGGGLGTDFELDGGLIASNGVSSRRWPADVASTLNAHYGDKMGLEDQHALNGAELFVPATSHSLRGEGFDASEDGTGRGTPLVPVAIQERAVCENIDAGPDGAGFRTDGMAYTLEARTVPQAVAYRTNAAGQVDEQGERSASLTTMTDPTNQFVTIPINMQAAAKNGEKSPNMLGIGQDGDPAPTLGANDIHAVAFSENIRGEVLETPITRALQTAGGKPGQGYVAARLGMQVRRLTPTECERLQGFPDGYTLVPNRGKLAADGPRYKALGNSMAVPCMRWIGKRIQMVEDLNYRLKTAA